MKKVLIVDNEDLSRSAIWKMLDFHKLTFEKQMAANGMEALEVISSGSIPDIVICSIKMPIMGGIDFYYALSQSDFDIQWLFTTWSFDQRTREFLYKNDLPVLLKPFGKKKFEEALREILAEEEI
jgi:two-component system, response regulator YesN